MSKVLAIILLSILLVGDDPPKSDTTKKEIQIKKQLMEQNEFRDSLYLKLDSIKKAKKK